MEAVAADGLESAFRFDVAPTFDDSSYGVSVHLRF